MKTLDKDENGFVKAAVTFGMVSLGIYAVHMVIRFRLVDAVAFLIPDIGYWPLMIVTFCILTPVSFGIVWLLGKWKVTAALLLGKLK